MSTRTLLAVLAAALVACNNEQPAAVQAACYHDWSAYLRNPADSLIIERLTTGQLSGPGATQNVPMFHDCQRLAVGVGYSPLFAIFATTRVPQLGGLTAGGVGIPAVEILALGNYPELNIVAGYNCLYIYRVNLGQLKARVSNRLQNPGDCSQNLPSPDTLPGPALDVHSFAPNPITDSVPSVARWDYDNASGKHFIGSRCGQAWCDIGQAGFTSSTRYIQRLSTGQVSSLSAGYKRNYDGKGWYDEQNLALVTGTPGPAVPSGILATVIPSADINSTTPASRFANTWVLVAEVALQVPGGAAGSNPYDLKLNLEHSTAAGPQNQLFFCYSATPAGCFPTSPTPYPPPPTCSAAYNNAVGSTLQGWWARIVSSDGDIEHRCVQYHPAPGGMSALVPVTARWHWLERDDIIWEWCPAGCCEVWGS